MTHLSSPWRPASCIRLCELCWSGVGVRGGGRITISLGVMDLPWHTHTHTHTHTHNRRYIFLEHTFTFWHRLMKRAWGANDHITTLDRLALTPTTAIHTHTHTPYIHADVSKYKISGHAQLFIHWHINTYLNTCKHTHTHMHTHMFFWQRWGLVSCLAGSVRSFSF